MPSTLPTLSIPLMKSVKLELDRMETKGVIEKVTEFTEWCVSALTYENLTRPLRGRGLFCRQQMRSQLS